MSITLSIREIYDAARSAGFTPHQAVTWTAIAMAESGGRTGALNDKGEYSVGLWQINVNADKTRATKYGNLNDPAANARAAYDLSLHGLDMRPWTTTHDRNKGTRADYRTYLGKIEKEIGVAGDPRGVHGYGSPILKPLAESQYDKIDTGRPLADALDSGSTADPTDAAAVGTSATGPTNQGVRADTDNDGLTDEFERLAGTDPTKADTDADGLSDGYEAAISHTDPLLADTDGDAIADPAELAQGTDPGRVPGTAYVVGEGILAENVRGGVKDADADGLSDRTEELVGTNANSADTDSDGLSDATEASLGTNPTLADSDADGVTDGLEVQYGSDPLSPSGGPFDHTPTPAWTLQDAAQARADAAAAASAANAPSAATIVSGDTSSGAPQASGPAEDKLSIFLSSATEQVGDRYVYGAPRTPTAKDPKTFDCSSFTQWAARQAGVKLDSTAEYQYMQLKQTNHLIPVEQALKTKGALLFYFSREPTGGLPAGQAHVAISLGDGRTVEAKGTKYGVGEWSAKHRFNYAATLPGISDEKGLKAHRDALADETSRADDLVTVGAPAHNAAAASGAGVYGSTGTVDGIDTGAAGGSADHPGSAAAYRIDSGKPLAAPAAQLPGAAPVDLDGDHDGLTDAFEKLAGTDPAKADTDGDGLSDGYEALVSHTDPLAADTDGDGVPDATELSLGTDPGRLPGLAGVIGSGKFAENVRNGITDTDSDGLSDRTEQLAGTDPTKADTDGDGLSDATEASLGTDPIKADTDGDGISDGVEVQFHTDPLSAASTLGPGAGVGVPGAAAPGQPAGLGAAPVGTGQAAGLGAGLGDGLGQPQPSGIGAGVGQDPLGAGVGSASPHGDASEMLDFG